MKKCKRVVDFIKRLYNKDKVFLHEPVFIGNEKKYLLDAIDSTFVSSVGEYVNRVEDFIKNYVNSKYCIATINGTSALHLALLAIGTNNDEIITQALSFVATSNAISYTNSNPIFLDVDINTLSLSPTALSNFLENNCILVDNKCINKNTNKHIKAVIIMHTFGIIGDIYKIKDICKKWNLILIEDSAEAFGSKKDKYAGVFGDIGIYSFNGNKIITSGGGGAVVTNNLDIAKKIKYLSSVAKDNHKWEYFHQEVGYNYKMPNINAALLLAQLENIDKFLKIKKNIANLYKDFFEKENIEFIYNKNSNFWLNAIKLDNKIQRDKFLECSNNNNIMTRPIWTLLNKLPMYKNMQTDSLKNSYYLEERIVNIPSGVNYEN